jgi:hypothetical protein
MVTLEAAGGDIAGEATMNEIVWDQIARRVSPG